MPRKSAFKCYFGCLMFKGKIHSFPPSEYPHLEKFNQWKAVLNETDKKKGDNYIRNNIRFCDHHFEGFYKTASGRLTGNAVPTLNLGTLHHFPKFDHNYEERFEAWKNVLDPETQKRNAQYIYDQLRLCNKHFEPCYLLPSGRLTRNAVPTMNISILGRVSQNSTSAQLPTGPADCDIDDWSNCEDIGGYNFGKSLNQQDTRTIIGKSKGSSKESHSAETCTENVSEADKPNETYATLAEKPQPVKQVLQLRLIDNDSFCDEPVYEVLRDDETEKAVDKKQTATQTAAQNSHLKDLPTQKSDVQFTPPVIAAEQQETEATRDKYKNKEYWKLKLKHILHNTQFCGVCLEADVDMNALTDVLEITDDERTYKRSLRDIVHKVFKEGEYCTANSQICNNCTKKLIQSYIFIHNAEETWKKLDRHLDELYTKICYVCNNSLQDANNAHSRIYNVVIALDNKVIAENFESSQIKIEKPESHQNDKDQIRDKRKLRCVSCNVVLPSYRAWKTHERTVHNTTSHRCRICLQSYKTQRALTTHYKTHLKSRCTLCHRTVQDGELLQHLNTRHKHSIHLCTTCNVAFYSAKALGSHIKECHRREDSKCVTCLQSLSQVELERHQCRFKCPECEEAPCVHHRHLMWYREQMANLAPRAKCAECRYVCTSKEALVAHVNRQHLSLQPHRCASCGHHFYCKSHLNKHICTSEKRYKGRSMCQYCDRAFSSLCVCKQHEKGCVAIQRKYRCDDCPANFDSSKDHMKHIKLKHGKEVLSCRLCDRVFLNDLKRKRHERQAHGEQRGGASLVCVVCQTEFSSRAALELHIRYHGSDANCQLDTLGQFKSHKHRDRRSMTMCEVCGVVISRILFKKHVATHSMATVSCKTCGKSFQNSTLLRYHQSVHVKSAPCPRCKKLIGSAKLWRHYRNHLIRDSLDFKVSAKHGL